MILETYRLVVPLIGIGLSQLGWLGLWVTRFRAKPDQRAGSVVNRL